MAWFNFGSKDDGMSAKASVQKPVETVDAMRQRAKYRLIGAVVLVLAGVVGFPMLFDSQPRPVAVDMPIEIPDKAKVRPLGTSAAPSAPAVPAARAAAAKVDDNASLSSKEEIVSSTKPEAKPDTKAADKKPSAQANSPQLATKTIAIGAAVAAAGAVAAGALKNTDKNADDTAKVATDKASADKLAAEKLALEKARKLAEEDKAKKLKAQAMDKAAADKAVGDKATADQVAEAKRAKALLEGRGTQPNPAATKAAPAADAAARYIVQFGAFSDADKAQEARRKVEKAGLKTYSQVAKTPDGDRIRVRVGPFTNKDEADKAAAKIKALDLPAAILTL